MLMLLILLQAALMSFSLVGMEGIFCMMSFMKQQKLYTSEPKLHQLIRKGADADIQEIEDLIDGGFNINTTNIHGTTPLILAVQFDNEPLVRLLCAKGADKNKMAGPYGNSPLKMAVRKTNLPMVRLLVDLGVEVEGAKWGTALHIAIEYCAFFDGYREKLMPIIAFLLAKGADINKKTAYSETPFELAKWYKDKELLELFECHIQSTMQIIPYVSAQDILFPESKLTRTH